MSRRIIRAFALILICAALLICLPACSGKNDTALTEAELSAVQTALGAGAAPEDITSEALSDGRAEKYESVKKVYSTSDGQYIFFASPIGYNGPIDIMLIIDGTTAETTLMQILAHKETDHYVRDFENEWFTGRFAGQSAFTYLERVKLEAQRKNQIVAVTGSTVTTDAVVLGVNDCFDVFRALDNPYYTETVGTIELTDALGEVLGEISSDQLKTLDSYRRRLTIRSASEGETVHDFRGVRLYEAIALVDESLLSGYSAIGVVGIDGYEAEVTMEEALLENNVYIMYEDNGAPITTPRGTEGALRLIVLSDDFGQRFTNYVSALRFIES